MVRRMVWIGVGVLGLLVLAGCAWVAVMASVEQPAYRVVEAEGAMEVREYPALLAAEVVRPGERQEAASAGFRALAAYIFARDRAGETIAMTAPVLQARETIAMTAPVTQAPEPGGWRVRFLMPAKYTRASLPAPGGDVTLVDIPPARVAAIRFAGAWESDRFAAEEARLRAWLAGAGLPADGPATLAFYNDPFTPGFLRRNEVMIALGPPG
jgi:hypothetical protein